MIMASSRFFQVLKEEFRLPDECIEVTIHVAVGSATTVEATYYAPDPVGGFIEELRRYRLVEIAPTERRTDAAS